MFSGSGSDIPKLTNIRCGKIGVSEHVTGRDKDGNLHSIDKDTYERKYGKVCSAKESIKDSDPKRSATRNSRTARSEKPKESKKSGQTERAQHRKATIDELRKLANKAGEAMIMFERRANSLKDDLQKILKEYYVTDDNNLPAKERMRYDRIGYECDKAKFEAKEALIKYLVAFCSRRRKCPNVDGIARAQTYAEFYDKTKKADIIRFLYQNSPLASIQRTQRVLELMFPIADIKEPAEPAVTKPSDETKKTTEPSNVRAGIGVGFNARMPHRTEKNPGKKDESLACKYDPKLCSDAPATTSFTDAYGARLEGFVQYMIGVLGFGGKLAADFTSEAAVFALLASIRFLTTANPDALAFEIEGAIGPEVATDTGEARGQVEGTIGFRMPFEEWALRLYFGIGGSVGPGDNPLLVNAGAKFEF